MIYDVMIIGAGAAGLMAGISAGERGFSGVILEKNRAPGLKILASGGGRCNFTNLTTSFSDYVSENPRFCISALTRFTPNDFLKWVQDHGIPWHEKTPGQLFCDHSARDILTMLLEKISQTTITLKTLVDIHSVTKTKSLFFAETSAGLFKAPHLIVATGGVSFPKLGATDLGYRIARQFGHRVTTLAPALDGFVFQETEKAFFEGLQGITIRVTLSVKNHSFTENILFTHQGLSGPASLKASLYWEPETLVSLDFLPDIADFQQWIADHKALHGKKEVGNFFSNFLPSRFIEKVLPVSLQKQKMAQLSKKEMSFLEKTLKFFIWTPLSTVGYHKAEVTRGGVDTKEISSKTMESKKIPGLYFVGEVIDITGLLGGYNFQWAWSSGWVAGKSIGIER